MRLICILYHTKPLFIHFSKDEKCLFVALLSFGYYLHHVFLVKLLDELYLVLVEPKLLSFRVAIIYWLCESFLPFLLLLKCCSAFAHSKLIWIKICQDLFNSNSIFWVFLQHLSDHFPHLFAWYLAQKLLTRKSKSFGWDFFSFKQLKDSLSGCNLQEDNPQSPDINFNTIVSFKHFIGHIDRRPYFSCDLIRFKHFSNTHICYLRDPIIQQDVLRL